MIEAGIRVGALRSMKGNEVDFFGYGVYEGDFTPPGWETFPVPFTNPRIRLDSGEVVWGMECWWGPEEEFKQMLEGKIIRVVNVSDKGKDVSDDGQRDS